MTHKKGNTYMDRLMEDKKFKEAFDKEYSKVLISEKIAKLRKEAHLTQEALAKRIHTTKSAISRYESANYHGYSVPLLRRIARACGADVQIRFILRKREIKHTLRI